MTITKEVQFEPSILETVDTALYNWLNEDLDIYSITNKGRIKTPVIWTSAERAFQVKNDKELRDIRGNLKLPLISVYRKSIVKDPAFKGIAWSHIPEPDGAKGGAISFGRRIKQDKTANFANAVSNKRFGKKTSNFKNEKIVYETVTGPVPTYINCFYDVVVRTNYRQQMNDIFQVFIAKTGQINNFFIKENNHKFEGFIQNNFTENSNERNLSEGEKYYETIIELKVLGYVIGEGYNRDRPTYTVRENAVEIKLGKTFIEAPLSEDKEPQNFVTDRRIVTGGTPDSSTGAGANSNLWLQYVTLFDSSPTLLATIVDGDVYSYIYQSITRYRLISNPYTTYNDAFYSSFNGITLSGLIARRSES